MNAMSVFGDYKAYKQFAPQYKDWKYSRDLAEAKRREYIRNNPDAINTKDIQKSKALLRAIDIMDEFSQKRAEDMEVATESVVSMGTGIAGLIGGALGVGALLAKKGVKYFNKQSKDLAVGGPLLVALYVGSGLLSSLAGIPLFSWGAKQELEASRRGRFEAMRGDLNSAQTFALLNDEQEKILNEKLSKTKVKRKTFKEMINSSKGFDAIRGLSAGKEEYLAQRMMFENKLQEDMLHFDQELSDEEIENAKRDQQLLTNIIEKIDIASQDYAENTELATSAITAIVFGAGALFGLFYEKIAQKLKLGNSIGPKIIGGAVMLATMIFSTSIQKEASRVGRFKVKQDLLNHPEKLVYVSDEDANKITDVEIEKEKKLNIFKFLKEAWKNDKEYKNWKKTDGAIEKATVKALSEIDITDEQMQEAKRLQHNTFKTFNKIDENSQKYSA